MSSPTGASSSYHLTSSSVRLLASQLETATCPPIARVKNPPDSDVATYALLYLFYHFTMILFKGKDLRQPNFPFCHIFSDDLRCIRERNRPTNITAFFLVDRLFGKITKQVIASACPDEATAQRRSSGRVGGVLETASHGV